jgi:2-polyprenyl-3-methyl-5-hydroxy-6-metoxy-1,4-benzoquinol methylase
MATHNNRPGTAEAFDRSHSGRMQSATVESIYRVAFGDDYPVDAQPNAFYSRTTLQRLANALEVGPGQIVVDLGCGHGGPSVWVARQTGANIIGIDLSPVGIELARRRAAELGLSDLARFEVGDLAATGLAEASCDAAMSLDVLPFVPDKAAAVGEVARILRPGGRFAFTTWEQLSDTALQSQPLPVVRESAPIADHRHLLEDAGFVVETYAEPPDWRRQQRALAEGIVEASAEVTQEMGAHYPAMARGFLADLPVLRYVFVVARRSFLSQNTLSASGQTSR